MTGTLDLTAGYTPHPDAMESRLGDETVILHLDRGIYFGLDAVGTIVWERLQMGDTVEAVCAHVRKSFADAPDTVEEDVAELLGQLLEQALIERR
jgi:hypothetical protein